MFFLFFFLSHSPKDASALHMYVYTHTDGERELLLLRHSIDYKV